MYEQVQLLVTSQDVDNYKQIKSDLDQLRSIVEKSELWVYKRQGPDENMDVGEVPEHKKVWHIYCCKKLIIYDSQVVFAYTLLCCVLQDDSGTTDKPMKAESTSSYNYRIVKEVTVITDITVLCCCTAKPFHTYLIFICSVFLFCVSFIDPAASQQVVYPRGSVG